MSLATIVETQDLVETVIFALGAGTGVTAIFSFAILGAGRFVELSQEERRAEALVAAVGGVLALLAVAAAIVIGVIVMTSK